jgi:Prealbumin-like fold domain
MTTSHPGSRPRGPHTRKWLHGRLLVGLVAGCLALAAIGPSAVAVHDDNLFELGPAQGADILSDANPANGPDWAAPNGIFNGDHSIADLFGGAAAAFLFDDTSQKGALDRTTYSGAGGSNKNNDPISNADCAARVPPLTGSACDTWHWDAGNVPAKDDLVNAYAYAKIRPSDNHLIIYSGFERLDASGDSHIDIEFLKDQVGLDEALPCNDPGPDATPCAFTGIRSVGDVIVSMDFLNGGGIGSISVHDWNGTEYIQVGDSTGEGCNGADTICAFNNGAPINGGPWVNLDKTGNEVTTLDTNAFTEFGVDVTALEGETPCISTIMGKTRSSASFTAELKDFTAPQSFPICSAAISIAPDDVNEVGQSHTFTVTVSKSFGGVLSPAPDGTKPTVTLTDANGAVNNVTSNTCANPGTVNGTCSVTFSSNTAGTVTGHAEADVSFGGETFHVATDGTGNNSGNAVKRFVDAKISIGPDDTNSVGESHTFTVNVQQNDGLAAGAPGGDAVSGFGPAPNGTTPTVTLTDSGGAINSISANTCASPGTVSGNCSITFTSNTAGTVTGHATVTLSVGGVSLTRATDNTHGSTGDATKVFVAGSLAWFKNDNAGNRQGGATFQVCRTHNFNSATGQMDDITDVCFDVTDNTAPDADADNGEFLLTGLRLGRYTVHETVAPPGYVPDPSTKTADLTLASPNATISVAFVNQRPIVKITAFGYTNEPTGTPTAGIVSGHTVYTVKAKNYGGSGATATLSGTLAASTDASSGTLTCVGGNSKAITGSLAPGDELTFTLDCTYNTLNDGAKVTADLTTSYTTNGLTREASGSPAQVFFTVQAD